jgi:hypothetical protein
MGPPLRHAEELTRRRLMRTAGFDLGAIALASLLGTSARGDEAEPSPVAPNPLASRRPHSPPRAKNVIYLHMVGAPSQLDLFDEKPALRQHDGQACPEELLEGKRFAFLGGPMTLAASPFSFRRHGESGQVVSELLPHLAGVADELAILKAVHSPEINHAPAQMFLHTGFGRGGRPSLGSWTIYGLGTENTDLPAYVVLRSGPVPGAGSSLWSAGFLPSVYQGIPFRSSGDPVLFLSNPPGHTVPDRRRVLDAVRELNQRQLDAAGDPEIRTRIEQYELAFRMQVSIPELTDLSGESAEVLERYGAEPGRPSFANNCLLARRLVERGVRMVQLFDADWDHHADIATRLPAKCLQVDQPMAALITDLKQRGLLDETLVVWGSEFGRTPLRQGSAEKDLAAKPGRDHQMDAFAFWLAGGGVRPGVAHGKTDDFGFDGVENRVPIHDLNATILHLLGLDHERLTFRYQGREFRLTDVEGELIREIVF